MSVVIKMSEKRFSYENLLEVDMIFDAKTERGYYFNGESCDKEDVKLLVNLLNEQQATITALNEKIEQRNYLLDKIEKALGEPIEE